MIALRSTCSSSVSVSSTLLCITLYLTYQGRGSTFIDTLGMVVLVSPNHLCSPSTYLSMSLRLSSIYSANVIVLLILSSYCNCLVTSGQHYNQHHHQDSQCYHFHCYHCMCFKPIVQVLPHVLHHETSLHPQTHMIPASAPPTHATSTHLELGPLHEQPMHDQWQ